MTTVKKDTQSYVEVFWVPDFCSLRPDLPIPKRPWGDLLYLAPKPWFPYLRKHRERVSYMHCPAFIETTKNDFVILAPFDLDIKLDEKGHAYTDRFTQDFFNATIHDRAITNTPEYPFTVSLPPRYVFLSKSDVEIEVRDLPLLTNESNKNFKIVGGRFNISKWQRPIDLSVEVIDKSQPITLRAEDPLFLIRFITPNNVPVKLTRIFNEEDVIRNVAACVSLKTYRPKLKLAKMYELAQEYISAFWGKHLKENK